jgi:23S rRNA (cytosine1962-C5)-methyltransferase
MYSYIGSWGVRAARFGAAEVTCSDSSPLALEYAAENAERNAVNVETRLGDALEVLSDFAKSGRRFDVVIVDPPALIKRRKDVHAGQALYERLNRAAFNVLAPDGVLVSCSCSHHLEGEMLQRAILGAAKDAGRRAQILEKHAHAPDHPIHPAMPETEYLKAFFIRA